VRGMTGIALKNVTVESMRLNTGDGSAKTGLGKGGLALILQAGRVQSVLSRVYSHQLVRWKVATGTMIGHIHSKSLLTVEATKMIQMLLFTLQLVLDALAVRGVANQREHRPNAIHKQSTLVRFRVIEGSLIMGK